jgi:uncharacterized protein (TIGR02246 family)
MRPRTVPLFVLVVLATASAAWAADQIAGQPQESANTAVVAIQRCFNNGDAKGLAELWKPDGRFIGPHGERIVSRIGIEAAFKTFFAVHKDCKLHLGVTEMRQLGDAAAVIDAVAEMTPPPESLNGEPRLTIFLVRNAGRWLIDSIRETVDSEPSHFSRLKNLAWMVGEWTGTVAGSPDVFMRITCDWSANGSFLVRKFSISGKKGSITAGTEVIGWDPRSHRIHSWVFESDGGFGQSDWTRDGDRWTIKYNGVLADGSDVSATHVVTRVDANTQTLESTNRQLNGEKRPENGKATIHRRPAQLPRQVLP